MEACHRVSWLFLRICTQGIFRVCACICAQGPLDWFLSKEKNIPACTEWLAGFPNTSKRGGRLSFFLGMSCSDWYVKQCFPRLKIFELHGSDDRKASQLSSNRLCSALVGSSWSRSIRHFSLILLIVSCLSKRLDTAICKSPIIRR